MAENKTPSPQPDMNRNRLPTMFEVLSRRTLAPVDLFFFYIFMRDQQRSVDYLDFWLDVAQHMSLCRHYVRELRRSVMIGTPDAEKSASKRSSAMLEGLGSMNHPVGGSSNEKERSQDAQMSAFLREEAPNGHSPSTSLGSHQSNFRQNSSQDRDRPRPSFMSSPQLLTTDSNSPEHTISRADIRQSAEKILYTFLLPGSEREIYIPDQLVEEITQAIEELGRDDPEVFDAAKDYVFQAMERDAFPGFLRAKALGNLVPPSLTMRLMLGLLSLFAGLWVAFIFIFLDYPRHIRVWLILPFTIGVYCLIAHQYRLDPLLAFAGFSEYSFMNFSLVREPYVKSLLRKRATTVLTITLIVDVVLVVLFVFVPGKRL